MFVEVSFKILLHTSAGQSGRAKCRCHQQPVAGWHEDIPGFVHILALTQPTASPKVLDSSWECFCGAQERANFILFPAAPFSPAGFGNCLHPPATGWERKVIPWHGSRELVYGPEGKTGVHGYSGTGSCPGRRKMQLGVLGNSSAYLKRSKEGEVGSRCLGRKKKTSDSENGL